jgi:hypothetical protein
LREVHAQPWQDVVGCFVSKHHDTYKIFSLVKNTCNYVSHKGKLELRKKTIFYGFRPTWCGTHQHAHIHHSNRSQKDHHPYIKKESCVTHHSLHRWEQIPNCGIVEVPSCVTLKMQCRIAILVLVKFVIRRINTNDSDLYSCVLSIWWRKRNGTQAIWGLQVAPPWLWRGDIGIDGRFCSLWILTTKKGWRKSIIDAVLNRLLGKLFISIGQKGYPFREVIFRFDTIIMFPMRSRSSKRRDILSRLIWRLRRCLGADSPFLVRGNAPQFIGHGW